MHLTRHHTCARWNGYEDSLVALAARHRLLTQRGSFTAMTPTSS